MTRLSLQAACCCFCVLLSNTCRADQPDGLVAQWQLDEGKGTAVHDSSSNGNDGTIHGATWVQIGNGYALQFDGVNDYVDCGDDPSLNIGGEVTLQTWIQPTDMGWAGAPVVGKTYREYQLLYSTRGLCWWYVNSGSNAVGNKLPLGQWSHVTGTYDGERRRIWINGRLAGSASSNAPAGQGGHFIMGMRQGPYFQGLLDQVRVYNRALSADEILNTFRREAPNYGFQPTWFERVKVTPYYYFVRGEIVVEVDYRRLQPLVGNSQLEVSLFNDNDPGNVLTRQTIQPLPGVMEPKIGGWAANAGMVDVTLRCGDLAPGSYGITVAMRDDDRNFPTEQITFNYPPTRHLPSPSQKAVGPYPPEKEPVSFSVTVDDNGGWTLNTNGASYPFHTRISWPHGEFNHLGGDGQSEPAWKVDIQNNTVSPSHGSSDSTARYRVDAAGAYYTIRRNIEVFATHVVVEDKITNLTDKDLGLLIYPDLPLKGRPLTGSRLAGYERTGRMVEMPHYGGASVFVSDAHTGLGMVPMDDVFVVQSVLYVEDDVAGMGSEKFALPPKASYTLKWHVYPTGDGDYWDFVNTFRKVENRIGTVDYAPGYVAFGPDNRHQVPTKDYLEKRGIGLALLSVLGRAADDPKVNIEGIEFMDFPEEMAVTRQQALAIHRRHPGLKTMFHVAHSLYATQNGNRFPDSKVITADGRHARWGTEPWPWWIYYPTPGNSFHDALLKSVDVMMDQMDMDGAFVDGFMLGYGGAWTYDGHWDQHSAIIDKQTKTIKRKVASVLLLMQPSMIEFARKVRDKGGIVIANGVVLTPSVANEKAIYFDAECQPGPECHLAPSVMSLANPPFDTEREIYEDMLEKLRWGVLYIYYNVRIPVTYPSLAARQYPITFQEIRAGMVRGPERIVTMNNGIYGWPHQRDLHIVYPYDDRGAAGDNRALTTVDQDGVRSELVFGPNESAVIEPLPASLKASSPVNVRVLRFDDDEKRILLNGQGPATLELFVGTRFHNRREGIFTNGGVNPGVENFGDPYQVTVGNQSRVIEERDGLLTIPVDLDGQVELVVRR